MFYFLINYQYIYLIFVNNLYLQNVTDEDSMVVQHILAVRKGTREAVVLNKDEKNSPSDSENEIKKENKVVKTEAKSDENVFEVANVKSDERLEENADEKPNTIKTEQKESEKKEESEKIEEFEKIEESEEKEESEEIKKSEVKEESEKQEETEQNIDEIDSSKKTIEVDEYYVKYRNFSYLHCEWKTEEELMKGDKRIAAKLKRFKQKMANNTNIFENVSSNYYITNISKS